MSCGYVLATSRDLMLKPFSVPDGMTETDTATTLLEQFIELYLIFSKCPQEEANMSDMRINEKRRPRQLHPGDVVYWELPYAARTGKHFFPEPSNGPFIVVRQPTITSVILKCAKTGKEVRRHRGGRPLMKKGGKRAGWGTLAPGALIAYQLFVTGHRQKELSIWRVDSNARDAQVQSVQVQPCRGVWAGNGLKFKPLYANRDSLTTDSQAGHPAEDTVLHAAIVMQVQFLESGNLFHGDASS